LARRVLVERIVRDLKLTASELGEARHDRAPCQPSGSVLERADRQQQLEQPIESARATRVLVTEQLRQPVHGHAARAQPALEGGVLIAAAAAHMVRRDTGDARQIAVSLPS
jgi:hypothetical protein